MKKNKVVLILFFYHLVFTIISYQFVVAHKGDSYLYWAKTFNVNQYSWFDFAGLNTNFILFLNYPFIKLGLPFWFGFVLYSTIGFLGILKFIQWAAFAFGDSFKFKGINMLYIVFLLPNLHFWTATLGKESLIFWGIANIFYAIASQKYKTFSFIVGSLIVLFIRPHVALMLLAPITLIILFDSKYSLKKRIRFSVCALAFLGVLLYMVFQLSNIRYWNWERISYFNDYSILSFKNSGSYVPMLEYNYFYKIFSFNFRPLFFDANTLWMLFASIENSIVLLLYGASLFFVVKYYKKINFTQCMKIAFLFTFIASMLYVQRYANLGIFMRTKIMFEPFALVALFYICIQGLVLNNTKA